MKVAEWTNLRKILKSRQCTKHSKILTLLKCRGQIAIEYFQSLSAHTQHNNWVVNSVAFFI